MSFDIDSDNIEKTFDFFLDVINNDSSIINRNKIHIEIDLISMKSNITNSTNEIISPNSSSCYSFDINNINNNNEIIHVEKDIPIIGDKVMTAGDQLKTLDAGKKPGHIATFNEIQNIFSKMSDKDAIYIPTQDDESIFPADLFLFSMIGNKIVVNAIEFKYFSVVPDFYKHIYYGLYYSNVLKIKILYSDESLNFSNLDIFKNHHVMDIYKNILQDKNNPMYHSIREQFVNNCLFLFKKSYAYPYLADIGTE